MLRTSAPFSILLASIFLAHFLPAEDASQPTIVKATARSWPLARGDQQATGVAATTLPGKPQQMWKFTVPKGSFEATPAIVDGVVYVGEMNEKLYALKLADGEKIWEFPGTLGFPGAPAVRDGKVYVGDGDGVFYCLRASDAHVIWKIETEAEIVAGANFWRDRVLVGSQDSRLYCLSAETGEVIWKLQIENQIRSFSTIVEDHCFVMQCDGKLHVVSLEDGKIVNSVPINQANQTSSPAVHGQHVFFGTEDGAVMCVDWKQAKIVWTIEEKPSNPIRASPTVTDDMVVVGTRGRRVNALALADGAEIWSFATKNRVDASPVLCGNRVLIGSGDGRLYLIDRKTGEEAWQYQCQGGIVAGAAVADGRFVVGTDRGVVYCFGEKK